MTEAEEIEQRFRANLDRVRGLVDLYERDMAGGRGRKPVAVADILRAAVVLPHATLEDLLRSLASWKMPTAPPASLERIPLAGGERTRERSTLVDLAEFRGRTVDAVVEQSVAGYLDRSSYNHPGDITDLLRKIGIDHSIEKKSRDDLAGLMSRRHVIAHRVDRNPARVGATRPPARSPSPSSSDGSGRSRNSDWPY